MINTLRTLVKKVKNIHEEMDNVKKDGNPVKESERNASKKHIVTEIKNVFDERIGRLVMAEERISEAEDLSVKSSETKGKKTGGGQNQISKDCGATTKGVTYTYREN